MSTRFDYSQWMITPTNNRMKWFHSNRNNHICHFSNHLLNIVNVKPSARFHFFIPFFSLPSVEYDLYTKSGNSTAFISKDYWGKKKWNAVKTNHLEMMNLWAVFLWNLFSSGAFFSSTATVSCTVNFVRQIKIRAIENGNANINIGFQGIWK